MFNRTTQYKQIILQQLYPLTYNKTETLNFVEQLYTKVRPIDISININFEIIE